MSYGTLIINQYKFEFLENRILDSLELHAQASFNPIIKPWILIKIVPQILCPLQQNNNISEMMMSRDHYYLLIIPVEHVSFCLKECGSHCSAPR